MANCEDYIMQKMLNVYFSKEIKDQSDKAVVYFCNALVRCLGNFKSELEGGLKRH